MYVYIPILIVDKSCQSLAPDLVCAINGSSAVLTFKTKATFCYKPVEEWNTRRCKHRILSNFTMHVDFYNNITLANGGYYHFFNLFDPIILQVSSKLVCVFIVFHTNTDNRKVKPFDKVYTKILHLYVM